MHTIWKGSISFGLVNIPIKLHAATEDGDIKLRSLHKACHTPIKYEKVCPACEVELNKEDIIKGFEVAKGKFVEISDDEIQALKESKEEKSVEIVDFIELKEIDPIYFDRSYFLSPSEGGKKAYGLLKEALVKTKKVGIAKMMIRSKEQLSVIRVYENILLVETIHYPDEVRKVEEVPNIPSEKNVTKKELDTAILLIDQLTTDFSPEKYHDEYRQKLEGLIEEKSKEKQTVLPAESRANADNVTDLMAALQASIDQSKPKKKTTNKRSKKAKAL
ncbi:Ku protein [Bacillus spongiae]|uniref:Non-homologous end joining protein Ku n=1 Tax=Bacillus spongiae TaxID=2683610 RepID=A0ABU8HHQ2_9BACI